MLDNACKNKCWLIVDKHAWMGNSYGLQPAGQVHEEKWIVDGDVADHHIESALPVTASTTVKNKQYFCLHSW
jgi:hypothetical protein